MATPWMAPDPRGPILKVHIPRWLTHHVSDVAGAALAATAPRTHQSVKRKQSCTSDFTAAEVEALVL